MITMLLSVMMMQTAKFEPVQLEVNHTQTAIVRRLTKDECEQNRQMDKLKWTVEGEVGGLHDKDAAGAVIDVIANRLESGEFGSTLDEVLNKKQINGVWNYKERKNRPCKEVQEAVEDYIKGDRVNTKGALYFCDYEDLRGNKKEWFDSLRCVWEIKGVRFYR